MMREAHHIFGVAVLLFLFYSHTLDAISLTSKIIFLVSFLFFVYILTPDVDLRGRWLGLTKHRGFFHSFVAVIVVGVVSVIIVFILSKDIYLLFLQDQWIYAGIGGASGWATHIFADFLCDIW